MEKKVLKAETEFKVRFSEVDSMNIVWHGAYSLYFEDAREVFGKKYNLDYLYMFEQGFFAPLVELHFEYKKPLLYKDSGKVEIIMRNTDAAKIIFDYKIFLVSSNELIATGHSVQVFLDKNYNLIWTAPEFFLQWKKENGLI
ncbi:MAG: acyl-CoA thioesterase [Bacteroidales bacterium]|jgi:acyl-CoA thioester hydrolase|nr:acyl-CoA thioesterase [Bacteroidales bacterium]